MSDSNTATLLNQYLTGDANAASSPAALLADHPDPTVRLVAQLWSQNQAAAADASTAEDEQSVDAECRSISAAEAAAIRAEADSRETRCRRRVARLQGELDQLRALSDTLALALGACHVCWGEDDECPACYGRGQVGAFVPQRELFDQYVLPALRRVRKTNGTARHVVQSDLPVTTSPPRREA